MSGRKLLDPTPYGDKDILFFFVRHQYQYSRHAVSATVDTVRIGQKRKLCESPDFFHFVTRSLNDEVHPITGHAGPEGEQMYSSTLPLTSAIEGGGWSTPLPGHFNPGKDPVPTV